MAIETRSTASEPRDGAMYRAFFDVVHHGCPNSDVTAAHPGVRIKSVSGARTESELKKQLLRLESENESLEAFVDDYQSHERVRDVSFHPHEGTDRIAHLSSVIDYSELGSVSGVLSHHGAYRGHEATAKDGSEQWWVFFESHDTLGEIRRDLEAQGSDVTVLRKEHITLRDNQPPESPLGELTPRQRDVLLVAVDLDYFAPNSNVTMEELADELDLSTSSVWEHLSKARQTVFETVAAEARAPREEEWSVTRD